MDSNLPILLALLVFALSVIGWRIDQAWHRARLTADETARRLWTRQLADAAFDGLVIHRAGMILQMNRALVRLLGCREREWIGQNFASLAPPEQVAALRTELEAPQPQIVEIPLLRADKTRLLVELSSQAIAFDGAPATITAVRDITQRRADEAQIARLLNYDALTNLPNRKHFCERVAEAVARNDREGGTTAVFQLDLDQFKAVNEQVGRGGGDQMLKQVAARITTLTAREDVVARIGGDKFAIMVTSSGAPNRAITLAGQLEAAFNEPFIVDGQLIKTSVSIGGAICPDHAADADGLMKASDFALKQAGRAGGGFCHMFSHDEAHGFHAGIKPDLFRAGITDPQRLAADLRNALAAGEISLVYQPVFHAADLALAGFEALARWTHAKDGVIPPGVFIPLAEQSGLIHEIGSYVIEAACREAKSRADDLKMSINLSPLQFRDTSLPSRINKILNKTGLPPEQLELEVTERLVTENAAAAAASLQALRATGVSLALDDFGTGYASLSNLCDFPFARLKIDKRFIAALGRDANADAIVAAIIALARNLQLEVTAKGVETDAQLAYLRKNGCHQLQGFLLGQPTARAVMPQLALPRAQALPMPVIEPDRSRATARA
jgi:diguanylate cyclase (GGDEF)-like protein/PAS domain S-box-containing protein